LIVVDWLGSGVWVSASLKNFLYGFVMVIASALSASN